MYLYHLSLSSNSSISQAIVGNFTGGSSKQQEIVTARNGLLEMMRADPTTGKLLTMYSSPIFGIIRSLSVFRLTGSSKDFLIVGSDSGRVVILEYHPEKNIFDKVHQETYGKTGCRRIIPGQYLAADPKGRAFMIGAVEKQKLVYVLNRDSANKLTISSPLEAHKASTICHTIVGVDVGYENPIFAALEVDYSDADENSTQETNLEKVVTYYELDLGLNHVVRKWSDTVSYSANHLIAVPGAADGPSGVLVCSAGLITWKHPNYPAVSIPIPRRPDPLIPQADANASGSVQEGDLIVSSVVYKLKKGFFILAQTEIGDLFKITMDYSAGTDGNIGGVENLKIKYFETLPTSSSICLLKSGFLFLAAEFGNHILYQIENLGDDDEEQIEYQSIDFAQDSAGSTQFNGITFAPRLLRNLSPVDQSDSMAPLVDAKVLNLTDEDTPQVYALCGRGSRSTFRILRHGLEVSELAISELPGNPNAVWTVRSSAEEMYDAFIIVSFVNATLVLSIGETVEEVTDTGFLPSTPTIEVCQIGEDALVQIYPLGIRHIRGDRRVSEWKTPPNRTIVKAACNQRQVVVALSGGEIVYFELDSTGNLNEYHERKEMSARVCALAMSPLTESRTRSSFLAVGCVDNTVRILSLEPNTCLDSLSMQAVTAAAESLALIEAIDPSTNMLSLFLHIGLQNGVLLRTIVDNIAGTLSDTRVRFLGSRPVKLFAVEMNGSSAVLALSSRPWLSFTHQSRSKLLPLSYETLEYASGFCSEQCPEGIVAVTGNTLRILNVEKLGNVFNQASVPLKYTPRKFLLHEESKMFMIIESDHNTWCPSEKKKLLQDAGIDMDTTEEGASNELPTDHFGLPVAGDGNWASCLRVINPFDGETSTLIEFDNNEAAFSLAFCEFSSAQTPGTYLVVGTAQSVKLSPPSFSSGYLHVYRVGDDGSLEFLHKTPVDGIPRAMLAFQGKLLVGLGKVLRLYDIGKKKLLRKTECRNFPANIISLHTMGNRIYAGDAQESIHYAMFRNFDNRIVIFGDDTIPRFTTASALLDYDTVAGGDKFGNVFVLRLPQDASLEVDEDTTGNSSVYERGYLQGAQYKLEKLAQTHIGDPITSLTKCSLIPGGREVLVYTGLLGSVGILIPFVSKDEFDFYQMLEIALRTETPPLCGRDHLAFRSYYSPTYHMVDGDLCERFNSLPNEKKRALAEELDRSVTEISRKLEDIRNRVAF